MKKEHKILVLVIAVIILNLTGCLQWYRICETVYSWKLKPPDGVELKKTFKYPEIRVNKEFSLVIYKILNLSRKCNGLSYRQVKGFYVSAKDDFIDFCGKKIKKGYYFSSVVDFMLLFSPEEVSGLMVEDGKLFIFYCNAFDEKFMTMTGDSIELELKYYVKKHEYKIVTIRKQSYIRKRFHWYNFIQNMEDLYVEAKFDLDDTWTYEMFCGRADWEGKVRPRVFGGRGAFLPFCSKKSNDLNDPKNELKNLESY